MGYIDGIHGAPYIAAPLGSVMGVDASPQSNSWASGHERLPRGANRGGFLWGPLNRSWSANRGWTCCHIFSQWCEWWNISVEQNGIGDVFVLTLAIHGKGGANKKVIKSTIKSNKTDKTPATDKQKFEDSFKFQQCLEHQRHQWGEYEEILEPSYRGRVEAYGRLAASWQNEPYEEHCQFPHLKELRFRWRFMHKSILPITSLGGVENLRIVRMRTATPLPDRTVERQQVRTSVIGDKKGFSGLILSFHYNILECLAGEGGSVFVFIHFSDARHRGML